ncbi:MAG: Lpg1974 family pore-forming outer membrane protein [Chlamydiota bacterium]
MHLKWNSAFSRVLASSVAALVVTTNLYAIPKGPCDVKPEVCCEEIRPGPFAFVYPMDMNLNCPKDFYFHADFLAMQAKQDGMEFVIEDSNGIGNLQVVNGTVQGFSNDHRDWKYNFGARFGMGFYLDHDAWNIDLTWTWLNIKNYKHANSNASDGVMIPLWENGIDMPDGAYGDRSSAVWNGSMNLLDARLGKPYHISRYVIFNPHFGIRAGWIDQHFSVDYHGFGTGNRTIHHGKNDFWGFGARTGIDTDWMLGKGWGLFSNFATAILFGKFQISQSVNVSGDDQIDARSDHYMNVPNLEIAMGLTWGSYFDKNRYHVNLKAGYEFHVWWDQLNMRKFFAGTPSIASDTVSRGNLSLNGFSLRLQLDI